MAGRRSSVLQVAASIALFMCAGPLLVIINKKVLHDHGLRLPALVSAMGIIATAVFTHIVVALGFVEVKKKEPGMFKKMLPVGLCTAGTLMFGNLSYVYLEAGLIQMLKAGTPALLLFMLATFKVERISAIVGFFVLFMVAGSVIAVAEAPTLNFLGIGVMLLSEVCEGMRCVLTQVFLQKLEFSVWDAGYYMAPVTSVCCLAFSAVHEFPALVINNQFSLLIADVPWLFVGGLVGIAVNFASFLLIKLTSSLLTKLLVSVRNAGLVLFFVLGGEPYTAYEVCGYAITVVAFTGYSVQKVLESRRPKPKTEADEPESV